MLDTVRPSPTYAVPVPLKWAGGKRWLVPTLATIWTRHANKGTRLVEPFAGGLSVAIGLQPRDALLNDVNPHVINFYRWVQRSPLFMNEYANTASSYARARKRFNSLVRSRHGRWTKQAAQIFYYLNRTAFNGLCRFNRSGEFNVPFGRYRTINYERDFQPLSDLMSEWELRVGDFSNLDVNDRDFIYADPPYDVEFTSYAKGGFNWTDQERLANWLSEHPGPVVASNQATSRVLDLYRGLGFDVVIKDAPRRISCNGDRTPAREMLAFRNILGIGNAT